MPKVLEALTQLSLQSTAALLPDGECADQKLAEFAQHLENLSAQVHLTEDAMNPKWNKAYGQGGTCWAGELEDGRARGGVPYFCPDGWTRFSLKVCDDDVYEERFRDWCILYHGTNSKHVGSILASGLRASTGLCYCGAQDAAVYMSPSIEYSGHPRYGSIEYNPETRKWMQFVLQCRVDPRAVWKKCPETMRCTKFGLICDPNIPNSQMEWLFRPTHTDDAGCFYIKDAIVCTGIMLRLTDTDPCQLDYWWSRDAAYRNEWNLTRLVVNPNQPAPEAWIRVQHTEIIEYELLNPSIKACLDDRDFKIDGKSTQLGKSMLSPCPFAKGGMRNAYFLKTAKGMYVVKRYNTETLKHIIESLGIRETDAIYKEVNSYLVAGYFANLWNDSLPDGFDLATNKVSFLKPCVFHLRRAQGAVETVFGEEYVEGNFIKWNSNAGYVNTDAVAKERLMADMASLFAHFTWQKSRGRLMVVDIQGWNLGKQHEARRIVFTDPQIHTFSSVVGCTRRQDVLYKRFSMGNLGRIGMMGFFKTHTCTRFCKAMGLKPAVLTGMADFHVPAGRGSVLQARPTKDGTKKKQPIGHIGKLKEIHRAPAGPECWTRFLELLANCCCTCC